MRQSTIDYISIPRFAIGPGRIGFLERATCLALSCLSRPGCRDWLPSDRTRRALLCAKCHRHPKRTRPARATRRLRRRPRRRRPTRPRSRSLLRCVSPPRPAITSWLSLAPTPSEADRLLYHHLRPPQFPGALRLSTAACVCVCVCIPVRWPGLSSQ